VRRPGEGQLGRRLVAGLRVDAQICTVLLPGERRPERQCIHRPDHRGQRVVLDREAFGSVHRLPQCLGNDHSDRFADIAGFAERQNRVRRDQERRAVAAAQRHLVRVRRHRPLRDWLQAIRRGVGSRKHREDAQRTGRRHDTEAEDPGMGVRRANHIGIDLAGQAHVIGIFAGPG